MRVARIEIILCMCVGFVDARIDIPGLNFPNFQNPFAKPNAPAPAVVRVSVNHKFWKDLLKQIGVTKFITTIEEGSRIAIPEFISGTGTIQMSQKYTVSDLEDKDEAGFKDRPILISSAKKDCFVLLNSIKQWIDDPNVPHIIMVNGFLEDPDLVDLGTRLALFLHQHVGPDEVVIKNGVTQNQAYEKLKNIAIKILREVYEKNESGVRDSIVNGLCDAFQKTYNPLGSVSLAFTLENVIKSKSAPSNASPS